MSFTDTQIKSIAHLARIGLDPAKELQGIQEDLNRIVDMVDQITSAKTEGIEPMAHPEDIGQRFREDKITETDERDRLLALSTQTEAGLFLVPTVIEE